MNHLPKIHVGNADCMNSFESMVFNIEQYLLAVEKENCNHGLTMAEGCSLGDRPLGDWPYSQ